MVEDPRQSRRFGRGNIVSLSLPAREEILARIRAARPKLSTSSKYCEMLVKIACLFQ